MKIRHTILYSAILFTYLLGIHDGKIALWYQDDPEPVRIFPYAAASLPIADREALRHGIQVASGDDLIRLLEAYLS